MDKKKIIYSFNELLFDIETEWPGITYNNKNESPNC